MQFLRPFVLIGLLAAQAAAAQTPCMPITDAKGVAVSGPRELLIDAGERAWVLELAADCPAAIGARKIRFVSASSDRQICSARGDEVKADQSSCVVDAVVPLDPAVLKQAVAVMQGKPTSEPAAANTSSETEPLCFDPGAIRKWRQLDRRTLLVDVRRNGQFLVHLANACSDLHDANNALFRPNVGRYFCGLKTDLVIPLRAPTALGASPRLLQSRVEQQGCPVLRIERYMAEQKAG